MICRWLLPLRRALATFRLIRYEAAGVLFPLELRPKEAQPPSVRFAEADICFGTSAGSLVFQAP